MASRYIFAIADGLGEQRGGAIASRMALRSIEECVHRWHGGDADHLVRRAFHQANQKVFSVAHAGLELFHKMQTTLTVVALDTDSLTVGHVGNCRLYRVRNECLELLTRDHIMAHDLPGQYPIAPERISHDPECHQLTRSIGGDLFVKADILREQTLPGDTYLLCSDGLWSELTEEEILITMQEKEISEAGEKLVRFALRRGAPDNVTAIIFRVEAIGTPASPQFSWKTFLRRR